MPDDQEMVRTSRTSAWTAEATPIVLRQTSISRLIFRPVLLSNVRDPSAAVDGEFIFQRKSPKGEWQDHNELPLNKLKAEEWVRLELKAAELLKLFEELEAYYGLVRDHGLGQGTTEYVPVPKSPLLRNLLRDEDRLVSTLEDPESALQLLRGFLRWISEKGGSVAAELEGLDPEDLQHFNAVLGIAILRRLCRVLDENIGNDEEAFWQRLLKENSWVIAQVYAIPVMVVLGQVYVGGKSLANTEGNTADFLFKNRVSGNVVLVEIKTPATPIVGRQYRNNVYNISADLAAATIQLLKAQKALIANWELLTAREQDGSAGRLLSPRGLLLVGNQSGLPLEQLESFELFRNNQRDVDIVTFDELRSKVGMMIELLDKSVPQPDRAIGEGCR